MARPFQQQRVAHGTAHTTWTHWWSARATLQTLLCCLIPGIASFLIAFLMAFVERPLPCIHDDFGNLLVADTLLHGRISNPTPPSSKSLQSFHVVVQPAYASKFPIGLGAALAVGKLLFGTLASGLWLSSAIAAASIVWMLLSRFQARWAFLMGMVCAIHPVWQLSWSQQFTNGYIGVAGSALVLGGVMRIRRRTFACESLRGRAWLYALTIAIGLALTLFSRPFEGGVICSLLLLPLVWMILRERWMFQPAFWRAALPGICVLSSALALQMFINYRVSGTVFTLPYQLHEKQYGVAPLFIWQQPHEPSLGHDFIELSLYHREWSMDAYHQAASFTNFFKQVWGRIELIVLHWGEFLAMAPIAVLCFRRERRIYSWLIIATVMTLIIVSFVPWNFPHYLAPLIPIGFFLSCATLRRFVCVNTLARKYQVAICFSILILYGNSLVSHSIASSKNSLLTSEKWNSKRDSFERFFSASGSKHLVMVRYEFRHDYAHEWVFNGADPQNASVVWARWSDEKTNQELIKSYPDRKVWLLDVDRYDQESLQAYE